MDNNGRLYSQVAAQAGVTPERAMVACYLSNLSKAGRTMDEAASLLRKHRADVREFARDWNISFVDYDRTRRPLELAWAKVKRGRREMTVGADTIAEAISDGSGGYKARFSTEAWHHGSSAEIAIRRASSDIERRSVELFGVDDIVIVMDGYGRVAPKIAENTKKLARALAV